MTTFCILSFVFFLVNPLSSHAQSETAKGMERIEQVRKIRMIEMLDLDEEQSVRFFSRLREHERTTAGLVQEKENVLDRIERLIRNNAEVERYRQPFGELDSVDERLLRERRLFFEGLKEILSEEQRARFLLFERQFQKELKDALVQIQKKRQE